MGNHTPDVPAPSSFEMNKATGKLVHPAMTTDSQDPHSFEGTLDYWDKTQYIKNMKIEAYSPITVEPFHTWQNMVDFNGRRYLYQYVRRDLKIFDITEPKNVQLLLTRGNTWGINGSDKEVNPYPEDDYFGAASIQWNEKPGVNIMVQSFEVRRFGLLRDKYSEPELVQAIRDSEHLKVL